MAELIKNVRDLSRTTIHRIVEYTAIYRIGWFLIMLGIFMRSEQKKTQPVIDWMENSDILNGVEKKEAAAEKEPEHKEKKALLLDAVNDLEEELGKLAVIRAKVEGELDSTSKDISSTRDEFKAIKDKIVALTEKEDTLAAKKDDLQDKLSRLKEKMSKVKKIEDDLKEV